MSWLIALPFTTRLLLASPFALVLLVLIVQAIRPRRKLPTHILRVENPADVEEVIRRHMH